METEDMFTDIFMKHKTRTLNLDLEILTNSVIKSDL